MNARPAEVPYYDHSKEPANKAWDSCIIESLKSISESQARIRPLLASVDRIKENLRKIDIFRKVAKVLQEEESLLDSLENKETPVSFERGGTSDLPEIGNA